MGLLRVQDPIYAVTCTEPGCAARHIPDGWWERTNDRAARRDAEKHGWQVRPPAGPGSRSAPDYCPLHREFECPDCGRKPLDWLGDQWHCPGCGNEYGHSETTPEPGWVPDVR